jgi:hypothetical protein
MDVRVEVYAIEIEGLQANLVYGFMVSRSEKNVTV